MTVQRPAGSTRRLCRRPPLIRTCPVDDRGDVAGGHRIPTRRLPDAVATDAPSKDRRDARPWIENRLDGGLIGV